MCPMSSRVVRLLSNNKRASPTRSWAPKAKEHVMSEQSLLIIPVLLYKPQAVIYKQFSFGMCCEIAHPFKLSYYLGALFTSPNGEAIRCKKKILENFAM